MDKIIGPASPDDEKAANIFDRVVMGESLTSPERLALKHMFSDHRALGFRQGVERCKGVLLNSDHMTDTLNAMRKLKP